MKYVTSSNERTLKYEARFLREYLVSTGDLKVLNVMATKNTIV
jgi:hypothetical protein